MLFQRISRILACAGLLWAGAAMADTAVHPAEALVKQVSTDVLTTIQTDKSLQSGDISKIVKLVEEKIVPVTDFQRMTSIAVGRAWRDASPAQREQLVAGFKQLLVRTYSGAVSQARDVKLQFKPTRASADDSDVIVRSMVVQPRGEPIELGYRLMKTPTGWKVYDINILGAWISQTYRDSFAQEVNKSGIDGLIKSLNDKNTEATSKK